MSSVLALKRNSTTVRYCFEADAEPGVLPRALELLAKRGLVPTRVFAQADADVLRVEIEVEGFGDRHRRSRRPLPRRRSSACGSVFDAGLQAEAAAPRPRQLSALDDRVDARRATSRQGKPAVCFVEQGGEVGAGDQDGFDAVAALEVRGDAAQGTGVAGFRAAIEDALIGLADEGDLIGLRLHDLDVGELAPEAGLHGDRPSRTARLA